MYFNLNICQIENGNTNSQTDSNLVRFSFLHICEIGFLAALQECVNFVTFSQVLSPTINFVLLSCILLSVPENILEEVRQTSTQFQFFASLIFSKYFQNLKNIYIYIYIYIYILISFAVTFTFIIFTITFDNKHISSINCTVLSTVISAKTLSSISSLINSSAMNCPSVTVEQMVHLVSQISNQVVTASKLLLNCH